MTANTPEKIYINGFSCFAEEPVKDSVEYTQTNAFIKKACDAYCKVCGHYAHTTPTHICRQTCDYYKDFRAQLKKQND